MQPTQRRILIGFMWLFSAMAAFVGGVYFRIAYFVFPSAVRSYTVHVDGSSAPPDGMLYSAKGIAEANKAADSLISSSVTRGRNFDPRIIITPVCYGYTVYYTSGSPVIDFPQGLLESVRVVVKEILQNDSSTQYRLREAAIQDAKPTDQ